MTRSVMYVRSSYCPLYGVFFLGPATICLSKDFIIYQNETQLNYFKLILHIPIYQRQCFHFILSLTIMSQLDIQLQFFMKNYRGNEAYRSKQQTRTIKTGSTDAKIYSPTNRNTQARVSEYENITKRAKEQLKQLEANKKQTQQINKYRSNADGIKNQNLMNAGMPRSTKSNQYIKTLSNNYSQKYFKKQSSKDGKSQPLQPRDRGTHKDEQKQYEKLSVQNKGLSPKKKQFLNSNEYKKLHDKLDSIENKITDMKKNLQKKKEEKQKILDGKKNRNEEIQKQVQKIGLKGLVTQMPEHGELHTFNSNPYSPRHNVYYVSQLVRAYLDERSLAREHVITSLNILKMLQRSKKMNEQQLKKVKLKLSRKKGQQDRKTIVFDLDETLIHCNDSLNPPYDIKLPIKFPTGQIIDAGINIRPYARQILKNLSKYFEVIIFTASHSCYANVVVDYLDPNQQWVQHRLFRQHCYLSPEGMYIKDLRIIDRELKDMVLVDNAAYSYAYQLQNGVPIFPYYHGSVDFQLKMLQDYLMKMFYSKDVREINQKTFKLTNYRNYYNRPQKLVQDLYLNK